MTIDKQKIVDDAVNKVYPKKKSGVTPGLQFSGTDASTANAPVGVSEWGPNRQDPGISFLKDQWRNANMTPQDRLALAPKPPTSINAAPAIPTAKATSSNPALPSPTPAFQPQGNNGMSVGIPGMPWLQQPQTQAKAAAVPVEMTAAPGQAAAVPTGITNYEGRPVDPYAGPSAIPEIGTYKGADGSPVYTNIATGPDGNEGIATANRNANIEALDSHNRYLATRDAADAITRAYNQPTKQNIIAGALAQKVFQDMGINEVEYKKLFSQRGIDDATVQNLLTQSDQNKAQTALATKQAGVLPGTPEQAQADKLAQIEAGIKPANTDHYQYAAPSADKFRNQDTGEFDAAAYQKALEIFDTHVRGRQTQKEGKNTTGGQLAGKPAGMYKVDGKVVKWDGKQEIG